MGDPAHPHPAQDLGAPPAPCRPTWSGTSADVRALAQLRDLSLFRKLLTLLAGRVGQVVNLASLGGDVGASGTTIQNWLSVLKASAVVFGLPPFFENVRKRVIRSPKIDFTDVGFAAFLLGIHTAEQASRDPFHDRLERPAPDELPGEKDLAPGVEPQFVHRDDVRVLELPGDLGLLDEPGHPSRVAAAEDHLHGHGAADVVRTTAPLWTTPQGGGAGGGTANPRSSWGSRRLR